jgi:hypothetical protein
MSVLKHRILGGWCTRALKDHQKMYSLWNNHHQVRFWSAGMQTQKVFYRRNWTMLFRSIRFSNACTGLLEIPVYVLLDSGNFMLVLYSSILFLFWSRAFVYLYWTSWFMCLYWSLWFTCLHWAHRFMFVFVLAVLIYTFALLSWIST